MIRRTDPMIPVCKGTKKYCNYAPIRKKIFLKGRILRPFEVLMPHQSVIMPPYLSPLKRIHFFSGLEGGGVWLHKEAELSAVFIISTSPPLEGLGEASSNINPAAMW